MNHAMQVELGQELLSALDGRRTALADDLFRNPVSDYVSADQVKLERERFFRTGPLVMGLSCDLPAPGSYMTNDFAGPPILIVRNAEGGVNGFLNVCRHRGTRVAEGCGVSKDRFTCPYHAWSYDLDGRLASIAERRSFGDIDLADYGLTRLPAAEKDGLIWVRPSAGPAIDPDAQLCGLGPELGSYGLGSYTHYETRVLRQPLNWKLVIDTFLEVYHVPVLHRNTIAPLLHGTAAAFRGNGPNLRMAVPRKTIGDLRTTPEPDWNVLRHTAVVYVLFPNVVLIWQGDHVETWRVYPAGDGANESLMHVSLYAPEEPATEKARRYWDKNMDLLMRTVQDEDFPLAAGMQRAFGSGAQDHVTFGRNEPALAHYHRAIRTELGLMGG
ncbi:MAG: Rieske 2Fe-2S domain-containing protein [Alphaproteobacteria bacterium]|nr:Rieske 2Fe-2S domain-containing protein [Alphaproteobacteria bacterium]